MPAAPENVGAVVGEREQVFSSAASAYLGRLLWNEHRSGRL
ncbi:hypothetical protein [Streptomyces sp. NPDC042319]